MITVPNITRIKEVFSCDQVNAELAEGCTLIAVAPRTNANGPAYTLGWIGSKSMNSAPRSPNARLRGVPV